MCCSLDSMRCTDNKTCCSTVALFFLSRHPVIVYRGVPPLALQNDACCPACKLHDLVLKQDDVEVPLNLQLYKD